MTTLTWDGHGNGNNDPTKPNNWSPKGLPAPGDGLIMSSGTMNISGYDLQYNPLNVTGSASINLSSQATLIGWITAQAHITVKGTDYMAAVDLGPGSTTVDIAANSNWIGQFNGASFIINGAPGATFTPAATLAGNVSGQYWSLTHPKYTNGVSGYAENFGNTVPSGADDIVNADVIGQGGSFNVVGGGKLQFMKSVSDAFTTVVGKTGSASELQIDQPNNFHGGIAIQALGEVDLMNLLNVDSYTWDNNILDLYSGTRVVGTLNFINNEACSVAQTSSGVAVFTNDVTPPPGTILPIHS